MTSLLAFSSFLLLFLCVSSSGNVGWRWICMGLQMSNRAIHTGRDYHWCRAATHLYGLPYDGLEILDKNWMKAEQGKGNGELTSKLKISCRIYRTPRDRAGNQQPLGMSLLSTVDRLLHLIFRLWFFFTYNNFTFILFEWTTCPSLPAVGCVPLGTSRLGLVTIDTYNVLHRRVGRGAEFFHENL